MGGYLRPGAFQLFLPSEWALIRGWAHNRINTVLCISRFETNPQLPKKPNCLRQKQRKCFLCIQTIFSQQISQSVCPSVRPSASQPASQLTSQQVNQSVRPSFRPSVRWSVGRSVGRSDGCSVLARVRIVLHPWVKKSGPMLVEGDRGLRKPESDGGGKCTGGGRREGGRRDTQGGGRREKWGKNQRCAIFLNRKTHTEAGTGSAKYGKLEIQIQPRPPFPPPCYGHPNKMSRFPSPNRRPNFFEKARNKQKQITHNKKATTTQIPDSLPAFFPGAFLKL